MKNLLFFKKIFQCRGKRRLSFFTFKHPVPKKTNRHNEAGFTLLELTIAVTIMGVLISYGMPMFQKTFEQSRTDLAAAHLETIWTAQRLYWNKNKDFADTIGQLEAEELLDPSFLNMVNKPSAPFRFTIRRANENRFLARARRVNSSHWRGRLLIDEKGRLQGTIKGTEGEVIKPSST